jgi:hypothetical protein
MEGGDRPHQTERTHRLRQSDLDDFDERIIANIEHFGHAVMCLPRNSAGPGWVYTVGNFDTRGIPELICIGLYDHTATFLLNEASRLQHEGIDLSKGRHRGLVGEVECEFRPVDPKWVRHIMGWATWYYESTDFPVLQAIYPDRENRFPTEEGFDEVYSQPLLQPDTPETIVERDFWASCDPESSLFDWKFPDPPHTRVFLSQPIQDGTEPVTYVSHDAEDGAWQFLGDSMTAGAKPVVSCFHHPVDKDSSLKELADLPLGWYAERAKPDAPWIRRQKEQEDEEAG